MPMKSLFLFALAFLIAGEIAVAAETGPATGDLKVTVGATHLWNHVKVPASDARHESYWSYSHAVEFTVPKDYEAGMKFLLFSVIEQGEYLRSESFSLMDSDGKELAEGINKGMPFTYSGGNATCTFTDAPASLSSRQYRRYASSETTWTPGNRFRIRFGFSQKVSFDAKIMVAFVKMDGTPTHVDDTMPAVKLTESPIFNEWIGKMGLRGLRLIQNDHRIVTEPEEVRIRGAYRTWAVSLGPFYPTVADGASPWGWGVDSSADVVSPLYSKVPPSPKATPAAVEAILGKPDLVIAGSTYAKATRYPKTDGMLSDLEDRWMYFYDLVALITAPGAKDGPFEWMRVGCGPMMPLGHLPKTGYGFTRLGDSNAYGFYKDRELITVITRFGRRPEKAEVIGAEPDLADYSYIDSNGRLAASVTYLGDGKWKWIAGSPDDNSTEERELINHKFEGKSATRGRDDGLLGEANWKDGLAGGKAWWLGADGKRHEEDYHFGRRGSWSGTTFYFADSSPIGVTE